MGITSQSPSTATPKGKDDDDDDEELFQSAVAALYSTVHQARSREAIERAAARRKQTVDDMKFYLRTIGMTQSKNDDNDNGRISAIHITGTKGKGSTAAFCESLCRHAYGKNTLMFTSPHLVDIRERIRINGRLVSKSVFAHAYWEIRRRLEQRRTTTANATENGHNNDNDNTDLPPKLPGYFRMLTLMALWIGRFHTEPRIDVLILEVGMGGRFDATNVVDTYYPNKVMGVTLIDLDHTRVLGSTLEAIAWEKGGIFTQREHFAESSDTTTSIQAAERCFAIGTNRESVLGVLRDCASAVREKLAVVFFDHDDRDDSRVVSRTKLGLAGHHQKINAQLALRLCEATCSSPLGIKPNAESLGNALSQASWPGRCQSLVSPKYPSLHLYLDGAHTPLSLDACLTWFQSIAPPLDASVLMRRVLIFNCSHERNPVPLLQQVEQIGPWDAVYFARADHERPSGVGKPQAQGLLQAAGLLVDSNENTKKTEPYENVTWQETLGIIWQHLLDEHSSRVEQSSATLKSGMTVKDAILHILETNSSHHLVAAPVVHVLLCGSLYLVGSALEAVGWKQEESAGRLMPME